MFVLLWPSFIVLDDIGLCLLDFAVLSVASIACWLELIGEYTTVFRKRRLRRAADDDDVVVCCLAK